MRSTAIGGALLFAAVLLAIPQLAIAQETVRITTPAAVSLSVPNVNVDSAASAVRVSFDTAVLVPGHRVRITVRADAANFTSPKAATLLIPASKLTWTTSNAASGTGSSGTLTSAAYGAIFDGQPLALSGGVDVAWTLKAPGGGIRAGAHTLVVRYKVESF